MAIRTGKIQLARHLMDNPIYKPWHHFGHLYGMNASCTFPFTVDNVKAALMIYSSDENAFDKNEIKLLHQLSKNISHGILHIRNQIALANKNKQVEQLLIQTLEVASLALEKRDPYTAGHQHRTADLATAIAIQMELPQEQIQGIALGAMVHDIGKIYLPAEILNRPGKLTDTEMNLIKTHPQAGFELVKNINYPWPIAQIILQHHERLDGSGYPAGLKGDEILLETKIVSVADVVEAMMSHRPYRPAHSLGDALKEIKRNKDILFDRTVVNACIKVFKNKNFKFQSKHDFVSFEKSPQTRKRRGDSV
jgi:HD-GYP domain-containing protein (c-di-GMP phosphodiesterase class II)